MSEAKCQSLTETTRVILEKTKVFSGLTSEVLSALRSGMQTKLLSKGEKVYREGESSESIFIVRSGLVTILRESEAGTLELESRGPGDVVGESALIDVAPRYATAVCKTDTRVFELSRKEFFAVMTIYPQVAQHVLGVLSSKMRDSEMRRLRELETRTIELQRCLTDHQRLAIKGEMASEVAHTLTNFIQALGGFLDLAERDVAENRRDQAVRHLQEVRQCFEHVRLYAESLLYSEHPSRLMQTLDFNEFVAGQLAFIRQQKKLAGIEYKTDFDPSVSSLSFDPSGLQQVIYTLVVNAAEAMKSASVANPLIRLTTRMNHEAGIVQFTLSDNGPGVERSILDRMFQQRVSTKKTGHGFGLMNIARIVAQHGGTVAVRNLAPQGAEFSISLPLQKGPS